MTASTGGTQGATADDALREALQRVWGYSTFRPLQREAMHAILDARDSIVVLPTGGGKSLCFQAPALLHGGTTVVISPLIALMKDQVDGLKACGVPAVQIDSSLSAAERFAYEMDVRQGAIRAAINHPIQGTQADIIKLAMIDVQRYLDESGSRARMILQVHDELVFEVPAGDVERLAVAVAERMERAFELSVPVRVDVKAGSNWEEMTPVVTSPGSRVQGPGSAPETDS